MYDDNNRQFDGGMTPEGQNREDSAEPNFVMRDADGRNMQQSDAGRYQENQSMPNPAVQDPVTQNGGHSSQPEMQRPQEPQGFQNQQSQNQQNQYQQSQYRNDSQGSWQDSQKQAYQPQGQMIPPYQGGPEQGKEKKPKQHRKTPGWVKKTAGITAAALVFGLVSGGTMVGVNMLADATKKEEYPQVSQAETQPATEETEGNASAAIPAQNTPLTVMDVSSIVEGAMPSVVSIYNTTLYETQTFFGPQTYEAQGSGSGIIVGQNDEELLIVTNNHVVEGSSTLSVKFIDETSIDAVIKGTDPDVDLAVIAVPLKDIPAETLSQISVAPLGDSDELRVGEPVVAIGNALGYGQSVTVGWVSALNREITTDGQTVRNLLQTDAAINPGNSGGALLNMQGEVIGINSAKYADTSVEGMGYAIPISQVQDIIDSLMTRKTRTVVEEGKEGYLGIRGLTVSQEMVNQLGMPAGVFVAGIVDGQAASRTDLREKDIITKFDGQSVRSMESLMDLLSYYEKGETVDLVVKSLENGEYVERTVTITLGDKGEDSENSNPNAQTVPNNNSDYYGGNGGLYGFPWFFGR